MGWLSFFLKMQLAGPRKEDFQREWKIHAFDALKEIEAQLFLI